MREELCTPGYCIAQILSGGSLCGKSCVDEIVEILLCEGGNVELCARTSKHIRVFAIDPLFFNSLSITLCFASFILSYHTYMLGCVCLCASLVFNHESFIYHLNYYSEESRGVSPEPFTGNLATLVGYTKCVAFSFKFRIICHRLALHLFTPL